MAYLCNNCKEKFDFPEVKRPDAGPVNARDIFGHIQLKPVRFCPECFSTDFKPEK